MPRALYRPEYSSGFSPGDYAVRTVTAAYTANEDDDLLLCDASGGAFTVTLPASASSRHKRLEIKRTGASGTVTIQAASGTIDGAASHALDTQYESLSFVTDGTSWYLV